MALDQYLEETMTSNDNRGDDVISSMHQKVDLDKVSASNEHSSGSGSLECNICLDTVQDPVVTLCGHLYCWPCIFKWLDLQNVSPENQQQTHKQCPVCKAQVSHTTVVPLYARGLSSSSNHSQAIPKRPRGPVYRVDRPRSQANLHLSRQIHLHQTQFNHPRQNRFPLPPLLSSGVTSYSDVLDPVINVLGETVCARLFGTSTTNTSTNLNSHDLVGISNARERRQIMQADKSLNRICFFSFLLRAVVSDSVLVFISGAAKSKVRGFP